jgi:hypothetical protein
MFSSTSSLSMKCLRTQVSLPQPNPVQLELPVECELHRLQWPEQQQLGFDKLGSHLCGFELVDDENVRHWRAKGEGYRHGMGNESNREGDTEGETKGRLEARREWNKMKVRGEQQANQ